MNLQKRFIFWLYNLISPAYRKMERSVQDEIVRQERLGVIREGTRLHEQFRAKRAKYGSQPHEYLRAFG